MYRVAQIKVYGNQDLDVNGRDINGINLSEQTTILG
jgi:hypothetical protein